MPEREVGSAFTGMTTLRSSREIDRMFREARRASHPLLFVLAQPTPPGRGPSGRVAFIAGKKLGTAVKRNRAKRVLREASRRTGAPWQGWDVVLLARELTAAAPVAQIDEALTKTLSKAGVVE